jgi:hypothetical protein
MSTKFPRIPLERENGRTGERENGRTGERENGRTGEFENLLGGRIAASKAVVNDCDKNNEIIFWKPPPVVSNRVDR